MATMWYRNVNCAVVYVDPAATGANTGATPADALTALPTPSAMAGGTIYLIRRGASGSPSVVTIGLTASSVNVLAIWGMPLSTDEQYGRVPAEAKTAWDADTATRPVMKTVAQGTTPPGLNGIGVSLHRLNIQFGMTAVMTADCTAFNMQGDGASITRCKTQLFGYDLATATDMTGAKWVGAFDFRGRYARVADSEIQWPGVANGSTDALNSFQSQAVLLYRNRAGTFIVDNCVFRVQSMFPGSGAAGSNDQAITAAARVVTIKNCTYDFMDCRSLVTNQRWRGSMRIDAKILRINNIAITSRAFGTNTPATPTGNAITSAYAPYAFFFPFAEIMGEANIDPTLAASEGTYACDWIIDTFSIDTAGLRYAPSGLIVTPNQGDTSTVAGNFQCKVRNYTFTAAQGARFGDLTVGLYVPSGPCVFVENCAVVYSATQAYAYYVGSNSVQPGYTTDGTTLRNCSGSGRLYLEGVRYAELTSFTVVAADLINPIAALGGITYIGTLTMPAGWASSSMIWANYNAQIFINSINISAIVSIGANYTSQQVYIANNAAAGAWGGWHSWMTVKSSSIYRTGGSLSALFMKTLLLAYSSRLAGLYLAPYPFAAQSVAPGAAGLRRVTVYVAYKGLASVTDLSRAVIVEVEAPDTALGSKTYTSIADGRVEADASTWNGDTGLSIYRIVTMVNADANQNLKVRALFQPFASTTAYIYIDPKIVVTA